MERRVLPPQAARPAPSGAMGPCDLTGITKVLVKFSLSNGGSMPQGLPAKERLSDLAMDARHAQMAEVIGLTAEQGEIGRVREGRVDTGEHVVDNLKSSTVAELAAGLKGLGYHLAYPHWFSKQSGGNSPKFVIVLPFVADATFSAAEAALNEVISEELGDLYNLTWNFCHVWRNPNGTATVNMVGAMRGQKPKFALKATEGKIVVVPAATSAATPAEAADEDDWPVMRC